MTAAIEMLSRLDPRPLSRRDREAIAKLEKLGWTNIRRVDGKEWWLADKEAARIGNASPRLLVGHVSTHKVITSPRGHGPRRASSVENNRERRLQWLVGPPPQQPHSPQKPKEVTASADA